MPITNIGSMFLSSIVLLTTVVNFTTVLNHAEPYMLIGLLLCCAMRRSVISDKQEAQGDDGHGTARQAQHHYLMRAGSPIHPLHPEDQSQTLNLEHPDPLSLARMISRARKGRHGQKVGLRDRICCYQWTWFTMSMATGGIANVLHTIPYQTDWLYYLGLVVFCLNLCIFAANCILITLRFFFVPGSFVHSFTDQVESLFITASIVSFGIILIDICEFGIPYAGSWLQTTCEVLFWVYASSSFIMSAFLYLILWSTQVFPIHNMTPIWVFPAYPLLLTGPFAANLINSATNAPADLVINPEAIAFTAVAIQGTGFLISFMVSAAFLYRLMTQKLPVDMQRPGIFISIGPSGFTCAGLVSLGIQTEAILPQDFPGRGVALYSLQAIAIMMGLWLWGLSLWFFLISVGSLQKYMTGKHKMPFQMTWWSFVFPNTALVTATFSLGKALNSGGMCIFGCIMTAALVLVWLFVLVFMVRALWKRQLLWPEECEE